MSLQVIVGPMFAGKTSEIQRVVRRHRVLGRPVLILTADIDNRYRNGDTPAIVNHDRQAESARAVGLWDLEKVWAWPEFQDAFAVVIDEAQFFHGLTQFVVTAVDSYGKHVTIVGLDGSAERTPMGDILGLIPHADSVVKLTALCQRCGDGTPAIFTRRLGSGGATVDVGGAEKYEAVCRAHFGLTPVV